MGILIDKLNLPRGNTPLKLFVWADGNVELHGRDCGVETLTAEQINEKHVSLQIGAWLNISWPSPERAIATCANCKVRGEVRTDRNSYGLWYIDSPYCPHCGAKMVTTQ